MMRSVSIGQRRLGARAHSLAVGSVPARAQHALTQIPLLLLPLGKSLQGLAAVDISLGLVWVEIV